ncbi:ABC transporter permease [Flavisolibacter nicotianae]|uniref:ABC transporter permease n=1 Tax=Flavisolibacter nicotianae TaxID=2364882 RepID=UPI000EB2C9B3|nr:ABC transporter permease [Flavisolibacter nicotianae]
MIQHHLRIAIRNLQRHKGSFLINLFGLSTGLACVIFIFLWVQDERSFDKFHRNDQQLFQVMESSKENGNMIIHEETQGPLAAAMLKDLPEVQMAVPVFSLQKEGIYLQLRNADKVVRNTGLFAGKDFFKAFTFPLLQGNNTQVLNDKNAIVISEELAKSLFGSPENAVGKTIEWEVMGIKKNSAVTGVFAKLPANSSLQFDFALAYDLLMADVVPNFQKWWNEGPETYLVLKPGTNVRHFNAKVAPYINTYFKGSIFTLFVRPFSSAYLYNHYENGKLAGGRIDYVRLFSLVALFILVIACINFMNLSTARASRRLKEVGVKKVVGSTRKALIVQFLSEAVLITFLSSLIACFLVAAFLPLFREVTGKEFDIRLSPGLISLLLGATLVTGLLAGSYPAFYLSHFSPITVLKGQIRGSFGELMARKGLVVFQFVVSLVLIIAVLVIHQQVDYVQSKNLGYDKDNVIAFDKEGVAVQNTDAFLAELRKQPGIVKASAIQQGIVQSGTSGGSTYGIEWPGKTDKDLIDFTVRAVDYDLLETLGIQMTEGRSFSPAYGAEDTRLIFNEAAIKVMGLKNPVGTKVKMWGEDKTIVGVVKDFHVTSLHEAIAPMVFFYRPKNTSAIMARIERGKETQTLRNLAAFYKSYNPGFVFNYAFVDDAYRAQYVSEQRVSVLSRCFAVLAILICCLGLFGLAAFNAEVRTKEIGIRKVLGASVQNIMLMLSKDFVRLVLLAILIAFPLAWWAMNNWLRGYAYHITISPWLFAIAGIVVMLIAVLTLSYQSLRTAFLNPVKSLRSE